MRYFPIWLDIATKKCLIIGGGHVAAQKARLLLKAGADVRVIAPSICADMLAMQQEYDFALVQRAYAGQDIVDCCLVIAATDDAKVNKQISLDCKAANILVNVADDAASSDYIHGAIIERDSITVAISSAGNAPVLARTLKARLELLIPAAYGKLADFAGSMRASVKASLPVKMRREFWERVLNGAVAEAWYAGQYERAHNMFASELNAAKSGINRKNGEVYLIGAGPGDPELLCIKAQRLLQKADVIVYDRLVSDAIMNLARREAERIYVGKRAAEHVISQEEISAMLVQRAKQGQIVARLKGGDPFIFGRGGEEISELSANNIAFQVVPAVTSASGSGAYSGIALTHRDYAQTLIYITGHSRDNSLEHLDFVSLARAKQTIVVYMGLKNIGSICAKLIAAGAPLDRPVAAIEQATTAAQRICIGTLDDIALKVENEKLKAPTIFIIGDVVNLHASLSWYHGSSKEPAFSFASEQPPS